MAASWFGNLRGLVKAESIPHDARMARNGISGRILASALVSALTGLAAGARDTGPQPEVVFELPLAPSGMTIGPGGGSLIGVSYERRS